MSALAVLIVNYRAGARLQKCVEALAAQTHKDFTVWIGDNSPEDGALASLRLPDARFHTQVFPRNIGFAAGNNRLAEQAMAAGARWLVTLNPDAYAREDWLEKIWQAALTAPGDVVALGSTQLLDDDPARLDGAGDALHFSGFFWRGARGFPATRLGALPEVYPVFAPCGAAAAWHADAFTQAGGFDEDFFCFAEDVELAARLRWQGGRIFQLRDAVVRHEGGGAGGGASHAARFYGMRNRVWLYVQVMPAPWCWLMLPLFLEILIMLALFGDQMPARLRGFAAGLAGWGLARRKRQRIMAQRKISALQFVRLLVWNPLAPLRRDVHPVAE